MSRFKNPPIRRHPSLQPLSRDHYQGLVHARRLMRSADAEDTDRRAALAGFVDAWQQEIAEHFRDEERLLTPHMSSEQRQRLAREHAELRDLAAQAKAHRQQIDPGTAFVRSLGRTLEDHIRWEERVLFPAVESSADDSQLQRIADHTAAIEARRPRSCAR